MIDIYNLEVGTRLMANSTVISEDAKTQHSGTIYTVEAVDTSSVPLCLRRHIGPGKAYLSKSSSWFGRDQLARFELLIKEKSVGIEKLLTTHYEEQNRDSNKKPKARASQVGGSHYRDLKIQPIEYIQANNLGYCEGNVIKYISRFKAKGGVEDLKKAAQYIEMLIEAEQKDE